MKFESATIKDIAKALSLSPSTVSRALRDSYEISPETKKLVTEYAKSINYRPNPVALSLRQKTTRSIGILVAEIANTFFSHVINGIELAANERGYNVIIAQTHEDYEREVSNMNFLASRSIDGCLVSVSAETKDYSHFTTLSEKGFPIVCFDRVVNEINSHTVTIDNFKGGYDATTHLINNGFKRIAILSNSSFLSITTNRLAGYKKAMEDHGLPIDESWIKYCLHGGLVYQEIEDAMNELLKSKHKPDAIFTAGDKLTTTCMRYCQTHQIKIPKELAIIGFSNLDLPDLLSPPLSVVKQPAFEMGKIAAELLIKTIESKRAITEFEKITLLPELFIRKSSLHV
ncbi:MAG: LacI family DNA-binding transcriptional regulator [Chitinophagaceae bacterium]